MSIFQRNRFGVNRLFNFCRQRFAVIYRLSKNIEHTPQNLITDRNFYLVSLVHNFCLARNSLGRTHSQSAHGFFINITLHFCRQSADFQFIINSRKLFRKLRLNHTAVNRRHKPDILFFRHIFYPFISNDLR